MQTRCRTKSSSSSSSNSNNPFLAVMQCVPEVWTFCDPFTLATLLKTYSGAVDSIPLSLLRHLKAYEQACKLRHRLSAFLRKRTLLDKVHANVLTRSISTSVPGRHWRIRARHRAVLCTAVLLLNAQRNARPELSTDHICIECRRVVTTSTLVDNPYDFIHVEDALASSRLQCRLVFPLPYTRKHFIPDRFDKDFFNFHNKLVLCRSCAEEKRYTEIDMFCAMFHLPHWAFPEAWRQEFGVPFTSVVPSSAYHNGRYAPWHVLVRHSCYHRRFVLPVYLIDVPPEDLCAWRRPCIVD